MNNPNSLLALQTRPRSDSSQEPIMQQVQNDVAPNQVVIQTNPIIQNPLYFGRNDEIEPDNLSRASTSSSVGDLEEVNPEEKYVKEERCRKKFYNWKTCFVISCWVGVIVTISYSFLKFVSPDGKSNRATQLAMVQIGTIMSQLPLQDLYLSDTTVCENDYDRVSIGKWAGSREFCYCPTPINHLLYDCPAEADCKYYSGLAPISLYTWKNRTLCGKRISKMKFTSNGLCQENFKLCNQFICIPNSEDCPITKVQEVEFPLIGTPSSPKAKNISFNLIRDMNSTPIILFTLDTIGQACFGNNLMHNRKSDFISISSRYNNCSDLGVDPESQIISSYDEISIYEDNSLTFLFNLLSGYKYTIDGYNLTLNSLAMYPMRIAPECMNIEYFSYSELFVSEFNVRTSTQALLVIIFFTLAVLSCTCFCCACLATRGGDTFHFYSKSNITNDVFQIGIAGGIGFIYTLAVRKLSNFITQDENYAWLASNECFLDPRINGVLEEFHRIQSPLYTQFWIPCMTVLVLSIVIAVISVIELVYFIKIKIQERD